MESDSRSWWRGTSVLEHKLQIVGVMISPEDSRASVTIPSTAETPYMSKVAFVPVAVTAELDGLGKYV